jgi:hypothetical protein
MSDKEQRVSPSSRRPPLKTVEQQGHGPAAAYLMKHADATALMVLDARTDQPIGIITDVGRALLESDVSPRAAGMARPEQWGRAR